MATGTDTRDWLNSLSGNEITALYDSMREYGGKTDVYNTFIPVELPCYIPLDEGDWTGEQWADHITCEVLKGGKTLV